jgi:hypothetical protein
MFARPEINVHSKHSTDRNEREVLRRRQRCQNVVKNQAS